MRTRNRGKGMEGGKRSLKMEGFSRETVCEIGGSSNSLGPKTDRQTSLKHESSCNLKQGTVFAFSNPILLWSV